LLNGLALVVAVAVTVEAVVDAIKCICGYVTKKEYKKLVTRLSALGVSILLCFVSGANLFSAVGVEFHSNFVGILLTGIFASRGANYINDLISRVNKKLT
jgi:hypothetical protein